MQETYSFLTADPRVTGEYLREFGLTAADCPALVVFDLPGAFGKAEGRYILKRSLRERSVAEIRRFLRRPREKSNKDEL